MSNTAERYGVTVHRAAPDALGLVWRARDVHHLTPEENNGRRNVFLSVYGLRGEELRGQPDIRIVWGWNGQRPDEPVAPKVLEKPPGEPMTDIPLDRGQEVWCRVEGWGLPSDTVVGLSTNHADEAKGNSRDHHSFGVVFQLVNEAAPPTEDGGDQPHTDAPAVAGRLRQMAAELNHLAERLDGQRAMG